MDASSKDIPLESRLCLWMKAMFLDHIIIKPCKITLPEFDFAIIPSAVMDRSLQNPILQLLILQQLMN